MRPCAEPRQAPDSPGTAAETGSVDRASFARLGRRRKAIERASSSAPPVGLEDVFQTELHSARLEERRSDSAEGGVVDTEAGGAGVFVAHVERRVVKDVETFGP